MDLSVITVNYNVRQFLENALTAIQRAMEGLEGEVFVVDNASDDGSVEMVKEKFSGVCLIENKENLGFAKANNIAMKRAQGHYILLINPDTVVQEDTFHVMLKFFKDHPDAGLAGCRILNPDGSFQLACRRSFPTPWVAFTKIVGLSALFPRSKLFGRYNLTYLSPEETYEVDAVSGSFMMMTREVLERVGSLDEAFFMYGEDLDWCYRVLKAGYKVYYVHSTKIVHFKGESTKRSDIDEITVFYRAMQLFVEKHISSSAIVRFVLTTGILLRAAVAFLGRGVRPFLMALLDFALVDLSLAVSEYVYFRQLFHFPSYAYPVVWFVPAAIVVGSMYFSGLYTTNKYSVSRSGAALFMSYVMISALVFFAKDFAFSRAVVLISGLVGLIFLPGWRLLFIVFGRAKAGGRNRKSLFGTRTVIVGTGPSAQELLRRLRARVDDGYDVLGFVAMNRKQIGEKIAGIEVIGSLENVGKVISEHKVGEVIFSTDGLSYTDVLSVIGRSHDRNVNFRLVPNSLEAIIGKTRIDRLEDIPLVEIEYNIHKVANRVVKRLFDIFISSVLIITIYPWIRLRRLIAGETPSRPHVQKMLLLPRVFLGEMSFVGRPLSDSIKNAQAAHLGPKGLTGLVQINQREDLEQEETERYLVYYAKNQSLMIDLEIMLKSLLMKKRGNTWQK